MLDIASRRADGRRRTLQAVYDDGSIEIDFVNRLLSNSTPAALPASSETAFADPLGVSVDAFFSAILDGAATMVDGKAGRSALEWAILIEAAREAFIASARAADARKIA